MYKVISVLLFGLCLALPCTASLQTSYEEERNRILSLDAAQRNHAVKSGTTFDTNTVLGKYFYNTVVRQTPGALSRFSISQRDLRSLRDDYPKYYLEHQILNSQKNQPLIEELETYLTTLATEAKEEQWPRLYRLAMAEKVAILRAQGLTYKAILAIRSVVDDINVVALNTSYDYSLTAVYSDLADAYRLGGNPERAMSYCQKLQQTLILAQQNTFEGMLCQSRTKLATGADTDALKLASTVLRQARAMSDGGAMTAASYTISQTYYAMGNMSLAESFAKEGIGYANDYPMLPADIIFKLYGLLSRVALETGSVDKAKRYLAQMQPLNGEHVPIGLQMRKLQLTGDIALHDDNSAQAAVIYRKLNESLHRSRSGELNGISVSGVDSPLQQHEAVLVEARQKQENTRSRNMTVLALFTTTISIVFSIAVYRLYRHKTIIESFTQVDQLTSVDNRWFAMKAIKRSLSHMERAGDKGCLALVDIDHFKRINERFGYETGDKVLAHIAKVFKYQLRREDVIGRYDGEKFIILLVGSGLNDGMTKIDELRHALQQHVLPELEEKEPLRFSCGLVEVSNSASSDDVIALCDALLQNAKQHGRNQTCSSAFDTHQKSTCA